jgi:hypothetical protein
MRALLLFLSVLCLSLLSHVAAADSRAGHCMTAHTGGGAALGHGTARVIAKAMANEAVRAAVSIKARVATIDAEEIVAPGDDGVRDEVAEAEDDPGYCDIWEADLLDPPDVLDELEESIAFFDVPPFRLRFHSGSVPPLLSALVTTPFSAFFKPPISLV